MSRPCSTAPYRREDSVARFFHPLILMLANLGKSELARQVQYLKAENETLRAKAGLQTKQSTRSRTFTAYRSAEKFSLTLA